MARVLSVHMVHDVIIIFIIVVIDYINTISVKRAFNAGDVVASLSTQYVGNYHFEPYKAIDGVYHYNDEPGVGQFDSLVATEAEQSPWIELDLQESYCINSVKVWDRAEGNSGKFIKIQTKNNQHLKIKTNIDTFYIYFLLAILRQFLLKRKIYKIISYQLIIWRSIVILALVAYHPFLNKHFHKTFYQ